jgi:hypothetical protein
MKPRAGDCYLLELNLGAWPFFHHYSSSGDDDVLALTWIKCIDLDQQVMCGQVHDGEA